MTGIDRSAPSARAERGPEFPPHLDLLPVAVGAVGLVAAGLDAAPGGGADVFVSLLRTLVGAAFLGPESGKISAAAADPEQAPALQARINRFILVTRIDLLILLIAVWAMVTKPGGPPGL